MICKLEIYNGELNIFPVVTNERVFAQITIGNIVVDHLSSTDKQGPTISKPRENIE